LPLPTTDGGACQGGYVKTPTNCALSCSADTDCNNLPGFHCNKAKACDNKPGT
jgi:hypothetical protein